MIRRSLIVLALLITGAPLAACTESIRLDHDPLDNLVSLELTPADASVRITDLAPPHHTLQYTAMGRFTDGSTRDLTDLVAWSVDRTVLGDFEDRGLFVASHAAAGTAIVTATVRDLAINGLLTVQIDTTLVDPTYPPPAPNLFDPPRTTITGDTTGRAPRLVYPSDGTLFPTAISSTLFQLETGTGNDAYRISFDSSVLHLAVETSADRWRADGALQTLLALSAGTMPIQVSVQATSSTSTGPIYAGNVANFTFSTDLATPPIYFWSASTNAIMRGGVFMESSARVYPPTGASPTTCVGCHTISRDGESMAFGVDNGTTIDLGTLSLTSQQVGITSPPARPMGWASYSPDGKRLVVANDGVLTEYNAVTGALVGTVPLPVNRYATHPDWSPDGSALAVALTGQQPTNLDVKAASVAILRNTNGTWSAPQVIVSGSNTNNNYFPRWSPDGNVLAFVHATTASRGAATAELMLVAATGGSPTPLHTANHRVAGTDLPDLANTMPTWGPRTGSRTWIAFTSTRPYGKVGPAGTPQIWITSVDLASTGDATTAAFWLPCQDVTVMNNSPVWAYLGLTL